MVIMIVAMTALLAITLLACVCESWLFLRFRPASKPSRGLGNTRFSEDKLPSEIDAVIIGSGQGGLSCASTLAQFGERVVVCEQHEVIGGGAHTFAVDGKSKFRFDAGHHLTIPPHEKVLQLACGADTPPVLFPPLMDAKGASDYISLGGASAEDPPLPVGSVKQLEAELCRRFPGWASEISRYLRLAEAVQLRFAIFAALALLPMSIRKVLLRLPVMRLWKCWAAKTTAAGLAEVFPDGAPGASKLKSYATGLWLDTGSPPSRSSFFMQTAVFGSWQIVGVSYPRGGPHKTALAMCEAIESRKGAVFVRCGVSEILVDASGNCDGVKLSSGHVIRARRVISALGYRATESLLPPSLKLDSDTNPSSTPPLPRLSTQQSTGFLMANVALRGSAAQLGISVANLWVQPATADNGWDAISGVDSFMADPFGVPVEMIPAGITFPSVKDGEDHGEHATCQILVPAEWDWFQQHAPAQEDASAQPKWARHAPPHLTRPEQGVYEDLKSKWRERLLQVLYHHYPGIEGRVEFCDISTPLTIENYLRTGRGGAIGLDVTPQRFVDEAEIAELDMRHPRVRGLWRAGQDYLMCGQVLAAVSGIMCALRILGPLSALRFVVRSILLLAPARRANSNGKDAEHREKRA